ncbi:hypothetical protein [Brucella tritici]|uniref:hypothetical protein n=1 Tax=Brucella tritici TaxID=94626 RepID=UPI0020013B90|nr:hypothetical protein [Brucella tritici]
MTERNDYVGKLSRLSDAELVEETEQKVWLSGFAANNPRSAYHWQCDACYDEAKRRGKMWLYQQGWNKAYVSAGHELSESDIDAAREVQP